MAGDFRFRRASAATPLIASGDSSDPENGVLAGTTLTVAINDVNFELRILKII